MQAPDSLHGKHLLQIPQTDFKAPVDERAILNGPGDIHGKGNHRLIIGLQKFLLPGGPALSGIQHFRQGYDHHHQLPLFGSISIYHFSPFVKDEGRVFLSKEFVAESRLMGQKDQKEEENCHSRPVSTGGEMGLVCNGSFLFMFQKTEASESRPAPAF